MTISYDVIEDAFLSKITEFELLKIPEEGRTVLLDGYLKRAASGFRKNCKYDLTAVDDVTREFTPDFLEEDADELVEILSEGMIVQWLKPYIYKQELLENSLNTRDFTTYSPAELSKQVRTTYEKAQRDYIQMVREYSYNHGALTELHQ